MQTEEQQIQIGDHSDYCPLCLESGFVLDPNSNLPRACPLCQE